MQIKPVWWYNKYGDMVFFVRCNMQKTGEQILEALRFRHACKEFDSEKKIPAEDFALICEAARLSPSSFGLEPWKFLILQDPVFREKIRPVCWGAQKQLPTASHFMILLARKRAELLPGSDYALGILKDVQGLEGDFLNAKKKRIYDFFKNDFKIYGDETAMFYWASRQVYIALADMMLVAALLKIDSCPIEGFMRDELEEILSREGVLDPERFGVCCMAAFGYRRNPQGEKKRRDPNSVFEWIK
jgi:nitroreductase